MFDGYILAFLRFAISYLVVSGFPLIFKAFLWAIVVEDATLLKYLQEVNNNSNQLVLVCIAGFVAVLSLIDNNEKENKNEDM